MGGNLQHGARFFPPKDLVYFSIKTRHNSKAQTFFFHGHFSRQKTQNFFANIFSFTVILLKFLEFFANIFSFTVILLKGRISRQKTFCFKILLALLKARTYYTELCTARLFATSFLIRRNVNFDKLYFSQQIS